MRTARDKLHAAIVLDHTALTVCDGELVGLSPENFLLAHELAKQAFAAGVESAGWLTAATIDRYLGFTTGEQKYGTNRVIDPETGEEVLLTIDRSVTDEERARFGVPPLDEFLERWEERQ